MDKNPHAMYHLVIVLQTHKRALTHEKSRDCEYVNRVFIKVDVITIITNARWFCSYNEHRVFECQALVAC